MQDAEQREYKPFLGSEKASALRTMLVLSRSAEHIRGLRVQTLRRESM